MSELAKRLVAHPVWEREGYGRQPGMVGVDDSVIVPHQISGVPPVAVNAQVMNEPRFAESTYWQLPVGNDELPDIENPATKGWLLEQCRRMVAALVMHPWQLPTTTHVGASVWCVVTHAEHDGRHIYGPTEGAAVAEAWLWLADRLKEQEADHG